MLNTTQRSIDGRSPGIAGIVGFVGLTAFLFVGGCKAPATGLNVPHWNAIVVDEQFRSEGVAVADVNQDGKLDVLVGEVWYEAPGWKMREIYTPGEYGDGSSSYSSSFLNYTDDFNNDGWPDLLVIGFPGKPCHWYENPKGEERHWKQHLIWHSACNETPLFEDLFGDGQRVLVMGWQPEGKSKQGQMAWFRPGPDPTQPWNMYPISVPSTPDREIPGTQTFSHGLGVGDLDGDGRLDVMCTGGWWKQPENAGAEPWEFRRAGLGEFEKDGKIDNRTYGCANMFAVDVDGDGLADVISSSAHRFGIWWYRQEPGSNGTKFTQHDLFPDLISQTHALRYEDLNGDGLKDLISGKRWWAHGPSGDPGCYQPSNLYWFEAKRGADRKLRFTPHLIDGNSGVGLEFDVIDFNGDGRLDIVTSNKKGTVVCEQVSLAPSD